jgi:glycosyltransferase involved in cell wall biosynthesis
MAWLSVVVPVYNEAETVATILDRVALAPLPPPVDGLQLIVVDDCSTDATAARLDAYRLPRRDDGLSLALERRRHERFALVEGEIILVQDADLEYDPADYPALLEPILAGHADVVYGSRFLGGPHRVLFFWHYLGNRLLTLVSNAFTDLNLTDMETCYKVFTRATVERLRLVSDRFGFEPEVTARVARLGCRVYEVPISYHGRTYAEGKKIGWRDGVAAMWAILRFNGWDRR